MREAFTTFPKPCLSVQAAAGLAIRVAYISAHHSPTLLTPAARTGRPGQRAGQAPHREAPAEQRAPLRCRRGAWRPRRRRRPARSAGSSAPRRAARSWKAARPGRRPHSAGLSRPHRRGNSGVRWRRGGGRNGGGAAGAARGRDGAGTGAGVGASAVCECVQLQLGVVGPLTR